MVAEADTQPLDAADEDRRFVPLSKIGLQRPPMLMAAQ